MNISGLLQSKWSPKYFGSLLQSYREAWRASLTLQETQSIHDSMNIPKNEFIS